MPVVQDDSLGMGVSSKTMAMNAGQVLPNRDAVEARSEEARAIADARKKESETKRKQTVSEDEDIAKATDSDLTARPVTERTSEPEVDTPVATVVIEPKISDADVVKDENIELKARLARLEAMMLAQEDTRKPVKG
jgi:hypothetical protein